MRRVLVASPAYLERCGTPEAPADLKNHPVVAFTGLMPNREWRFQNGQKTGVLNLSPPMEINDSSAAIEAAEKAHGVTIALSYMVSEKIKKGTLMPVLETFALPPQPVHLVYPQARLVASKVRAFIDFAGPRLKTALDQLA